MKKEQQDKLWNELSEESKKAILEEYDDGSFDDWNGIQALEVTFGTHNLNPEHPTPKTWEDVEKSDLSFVADKTNDYMHHLEASYYTDSKVWNKAIATLKIAKLIDLGYGGMVSEKEYEENGAWQIIPYREVYDEGFKLKIVIDFQEKFFISFHDEQQAREFMSYESNRKLVEQYYMM